MNEGELGDIAHKMLIHLDRLNQMHPEEERVTPREITTAIIRGDPELLQVLDEIKRRGHGK
jgi:hypothetical protein